MNEEDGSFNHGGGDGGIGLCLFVIGTGIVIGGRVVVVCVSSFRVWPIEINVLHVMVAVSYSLSPPSSILPLAVIVVVRDNMGVRF